MIWSHVEFYEKGDSFFAALVEAFRQAQTSISLEFYIFRMDRVGTELLTALCEAQSRGVKVFLRLDGVGAREDIQAIGAFCEKGNLELEVFHPLPFEAIGSYFPSGFAKSDSFLTRWKFINRRNHRKIVIIDEKFAFTGGMNVKENQSERYNGAQAWHDLSVKLEGPGVKDLIQAFWFRHVKHFSFGSCLTNYSWKLRKLRNSWLSHAIHHARQRVWIVTPYFAPTPKMLLQLKSASRRGVDIRIVLTKKTDVAVSRLAAIGLYRKMITWGVKIFEYEPSLLHRKLWIIDDLSLVGSTNFNHRSFIHDLELDVIFREPQNVKRAAELFAGDQKQSREIKIEYFATMGLRKIILSWIAGWFTYWL